MATWSQAMHRYGVRTEFNSGHEFLDEALHVTLGRTDETWLVHMTPEGTVAVRLWPGLADIVPTVSDALAAISHAVEQRSEPGRD
jgi:hypothetical protein